MLAAAIAATRITFVTFAMVSFSCESVNTTIALLSDTPEDSVPLRQIPSRVVEKLLNLMPLERMPPYSTDQYCHLVSRMVVTPRTCTVYASGYVYETRS
jgi:hypothetical protein